MVAACAGKADSASGSWKCLRRSAIVHHVPRKIANWLPIWNARDSIWHLVEKVPTENFATSDARAR